jgi:hypothetical protein
MIGMRDDESDGDKKRCDGEDVVTMTMTTKNNQPQLNNWHCRIRK